LVGAYHFFRFNKSGKDQAEWFIRNVKLTNIDLPPVIDVELSYGNIFSHQSKDKIISEIFIFLKTIERHYKVKPMIYTNIKTYSEYIKENFDDYDLWICKLCSQTNIDNWKFWQYNHKANVAGIANEVDMNTFNGSYEDFINYIYKKNNALQDTIN
jgi:lysozyme